MTDFLSAVLEPDQEPSLITPQMIDKFFLRRGPELARRTFCHTVLVVRNFMRYGFECGALPQALHRFELPMAFRFEQPPRALPWHHVQALLSSIDQSTPAGLRDHAMLHLMACYGLRPGEVAALRVTSIDEAASTLRVEQSKTRSTLLLPLMPNSIEVLRTHLARRIAASRFPHLFLNANTPHGPLTAGAVSYRFKIHAKRSGLPIADASAYALRHTFAMRLLGAGVDMKAIGDLMGHRSLASTSAYLRIQNDMLREIALDVPTPGDAR